MRFLFTIVGSLAVAALSGCCATPAPPTVPTTVRTAQAIERASECHAGEQGALEQTGSELDVAIAGQGFFCVTLGDGCGYTRSGNFFRDANGQLVVGIGDGYVLQPPIALPKGVTRIKIDQDGTVQYVAATGTTLCAGHLLLARFDHPAGLKQVGARVYASTQDSGVPTVSPASRHGFGKIMQGFVEADPSDPRVGPDTTSRTSRS